MTRAFEDVVEGLYRLDADEIHEVLKFNGIKGRRADGGQCPLARYIVRECGFDSVHVGSFIAPDFYTPGDGDHWDRVVDSPASVKYFITLFDQGHFPDLIEREES